MKSETQPTLHSEKKFTNTLIATIDPNLPSCYIFDIDGTLAIMGDRSPYDWTKVGIDMLNISVSTVLNALYKQGNQKIIIVSGRDSVCRSITEKWLADNRVEYHELYMRPESDMRKDVEIKNEIYQNHIKGKYNVMGIVDDRPVVCRMWRSLGLPVFQVADPEIEF